MMKVFSMMEIHEAIAHALDGKQSLHLHCIVFDRSPRCFRDAVEKRKEPIAHLYDQDEARLRATAKKYGINVVVIDGRSPEDMHIDFCASPLRKLLYDLAKRLKANHSVKLLDDLKEKLSEYPGAAKWLGAL